MIESVGIALFTLQPVVMEYVTERFIEQIIEEIETEKIELLGSHSLIKAQAKDYVRGSQVRLILKPIAERLLLSLGKSGSEKNLKSIIAKLWKKQPSKPGYEAGNVLNLLIELQVDLRGYDFSFLTVWQAYLQGVSLPEVNFSHANLAKSVFTENFGSVLSVALNSNGALLAAGTTDGEVRLWQLHSGTPLFSCKEHTDWVRSVVFNSKRNMFASGSDDKTVRLWDVDTGQCLNILQGHNNRIWSVAFSSDGKTIASGSEDQTIRLWDVDTGQCCKILQGHSSLVRSVAFSLDGSMIASGSQDKTVRLWDISTGQCLKTLQVYNSWIWSVAFCPDGSMVVSGSNDGTIKLWDLLSGECVKTLRGEKPYEHMNIHGVEGLTESQKAALIVLGAIEEE